jgi:hypothetical protein
MANNPKRTNLAANTACDAMAALANSGKLRIYDSTGTGQPATADTAVTTQVLLAELTMNATAFGSAVAGVATANAITSDASADATGTATWFRLLKSDGTTVLWDGSVGTSGADLNLTTVSIVAAAAVNITAFTVTESKG